MSASIKYTILETKWGYFGLAGTESGLLRACLPLATPDKVKAQLLAGIGTASYDESLFDAVQEQIAAYFEGAIVPQGADPQEKYVIYRQKHTMRRGETLYTALRYVVLSPQADLPACYIKRKNEKIFVDLDDYLYNYDSNKDVVLQPLDCIVIPYIR